MYNKKVIDEFSCPKNVGEIDGADGVGKVGNAKCGDIMKMFLKIEDGVIVDAKFQTFGCAAAIASSSVATELLKGKTIEEARKITNNQVMAELVELPPQKVHCSVLAEEAIKAALDDYRAKSEKKEGKEKRKKKPVKGKA